MDTKSKKKKLAVSFGIFFLGVSLLLAGGAACAKRYLFYGWGGDRGFGEMMERDYQNTQGFREFMQERLLDFLEIGSEGGFRSAQAKRYHTLVREDKNLCYRIRRNGQNLYSNMDGLQWEKGGKLPERYNFVLFFDGQKVSMQKDGIQVEVYGDGYYRGHSQWYVPGYQNFTVDEEMKQVEVTMLAAREPVPYSYIKYREGGYASAGSQLYEIAQQTAAGWRTMRAALVLLAAGAVLFVISLFFWKEKQAVDVKIGKITGKIWIECKLAAVILLAMGLYAAASAGAWYGFGAAAEDAYGLAETEADSAVSVKQEESLDTAASSDRKTIQPSQQLQETRVWTNGRQEAIVNGAVFEGTQTGVDLAEWAGGFKNGMYSLLSVLAANPDLVLVIFWLLYVLGNDLMKNRGQIWDGILRRTLREARIRDMKQPFALQQMRRFLLYAGVSVSAALAVLLVMACYSKRMVNGTETVLTVCLVFAVFAVVSVSCLRRTRREAAALDGLADYIRAIQGGDYGECKQDGQAEQTGFMPLFDSLSKIRQGFHTAVQKQMQSERMKVELVANVSHDLKTPLTSIISYIAFLKQEEELPEHVRDYIRILDEKAERLHTIVQDVFAVSKAASGQLPVEIKTLDFGKLLRQTLADMDEQIQAAAVQIKADIPTEPVLIAADGARLYRVFQNLLQNALQYSVDGTRVFVELHTDGDKAWASVKNISRMELRAGVDFTQRFLRGDQSRTDGGAGLGLSIAKSFTEACAGGFYLETDADLFIARVVFCLERA